MNNSVRMKGWCDWMRLPLMLGLFLLLSFSAPAISRQPVGANSIGAQSTWQSPDQRPAGTKQIISTILIVIGSIGMFVSQIYFIVRAFKTSTAWGVCMLLFCGITALFFCLFEFGQARRPLGLLLLSIGAVVGGVYLSGPG